jgi:hypothetical protein
MCRRFVEVMIEDGREKVLRPISSRILEAWERRITPLLEREARRKPFVVQEITEWIKTMLRSHRGEMTFRALSSGLQSHEVSRVFLSVLMLATAQEVLLSPVDESGGTTEFVVKLQDDRERTMEDLDE